MMREFEEVRKNNICIPLCFNKENKQNKQNEQNDQNENESGYEYEDENPYSESDGDNQQCTQMFPQSQHQHTQQQEVYIY